MTIDLKDPIGRFIYTEKFTPHQREGYIATLEDYPKRLSEAVRGLSDEQLDQSYRDGGWTIRQLVHHIADANGHFNYRFRYAMTEEHPQIKAFNENKWAELEDAKHAPVESSLVLLRGIHARWILLLRSLKEEDFRREFIHPVYGQMPLDRALGMYSWHSLHHLAQIEGLCAQKGWK
ncbi:MAG: YfiT family bacillithiol transferase [Candidatus Sumerlaeota bacterium]